MEKSTKITSLFVLIIIFAMLFTSVTVLSVEQIADAAELSPLERCETQVDFIENNFERFIAEYNASVDLDEQSEATY